MIYKLFCTLHLEHMELWEQWYSIISENQKYIWKIFLTIFIIIFLILFRKFTLTTIKKKTKALIYESWKKNSTYISYILIPFLTLLVWLPDIRGFFTLFSIIGTGLIVALKEVFLNLAGWLYIITRRPFEVGNRIMIEDNIGDVIDIRPFEFSMIEVKAREQGGQSTGRIFRVPNSLLFSKPLANSSKEFSLYWNEIKIPLTRRSNWQKALEITEQVASEVIEQIYENDARIRKAETKHRIHYNQLEPKTYVEYLDSSIVVTLRHLSEPRKTREITDRFWRTYLEKITPEKEITLM